MSELRDRIAVAVAVVGFNDPWATPPQPGEFDYEVADAVIAELGLKHYCRECGGWGPMDD